MISAKEDAWPDFKVNLWKLFQDTNIGSQESGFYILETFLGFAPEHFKNDDNNLLPLFRLGLEHENGKLKLSALKCFESFLEGLEIKKQSIYHGLIIPVFQAVYILIERDSKEEGL